MPDAASLRREAEELRRRADELDAEADEVEFERKYGFARPSNDGVGPAMVACRAAVSEWWGRLGGATGFSYDADFRDFYYRHLPEIPEPGLTTACVEYAKMRRDEWLAARAAAKAQRAAKEMMPNAPDHH